MLAEQILIWEVLLQMVVIYMVPYIADESTPSTIMLYPAYALHLNAHIINKIICHFKWGCDIIKITGYSLRAQEILWAFTPLLVNTMELHISETD
jgi:hypothetical protein